MEYNLSENHQLGKHCYECLHCNWKFGGPDNLPMTWKCEKGMSFDPDKDINEWHEWLLVEGKEVFPEIYAEAIKQCKEFEISRYFV